MAKSPKVPSHKNSKAVSSGLNAKHSSSLGGKNFKAYKNQYYKNGHNNNHSNSLKNRRFSIAESSSSDSDKVYDNATVYEVESISDSESSLTAVSDDGSSKQTQFATPKYNSQSKSGLKGVSKKKKSSKKSINWDWNQNINDSDGSDNSDEDDDDEDDDDDDDEDLFSSSDDESDVDFIKLQAQKKVKSLQAARAMKSLKAKQAQVNNHTSHIDEVSDVDSALESESEVDISDITSLAQQKSSIIQKQINGDTDHNNKAKFGRRRSDAILPEGINFTFEFDDFEKKDQSEDNGHDDDDGDEQEDDDMESNAVSEADEKFEVQEEDIGEEIDIDTEGNIPNNHEVIDKVTDFNFDFDNQLIQVPKIKDSELSSDEDYEIDDNELLATLQADNDLEEFTNPGVERQAKFRRSSSADSIGDDEESDPFLKEEEKFLVNEFETNGFDDEEEEIGIEDYNFSDSSNRKTLINSFKAIDTHGDSKHVLQYESSIDSGSESEVEDDEEDDGYEDLIDFNTPFFTHTDNDSSKIKSQSNTESFDIKDKKDKHKHKHKHKTKPSAMNSDEDDDTYLWNYFFSSDNGGSSDEEGDDGYVEDDDDKIADEISKSMDTKSSNRRMTLTPASNLNVNRRKSVAQSHVEFSDRSNVEDGYDSGESTDEDLSIPKSTNKTKVGSQKAKEVLSSKTADYRPPILGTWVALDSKPFGIIDGLSTRILQTGTGNKGFEFKSKARRSIVAHNDVSDDSAMGLDELLNVSELDNDDENDIKIWRDFNSQKKRVPLGAFRNKSILQNALIHPENVTAHYHASKSSFNKHRKSSVVKPSGHNQVNKPSSSARKSSLAATATTASAAASAGAGAVASGSSLSTKQRRRRASIVEAVSEGFRTTKSGLFNETALSNVEEMLGDDNDLMALIKGL